MGKVADILRCWLLASFITRPIYFILRAIKRFGREFFAFTKSLWFVGCRIVPLILMHRQRPVWFNRWLGAGDIICTFPAALKIRECHPNTVFIYNCHPDFACLPPMAGVATLTTATVFAPVKKYWAFLFQAIYDFRWGEDGKNFYVSADFPIETYCRQHSVEPVRDHPRLTVPPSLQQRIEALLSPLPLVSGQPIVVFHTGPTWAIREWPLASWHELVGRLRADGFQNLIHVGASKNAFIGEQPTDTIPGVISLVDKLTLEETIGLIARANLLVGIDSGLLHMAAGVQTPFVGVWGPTSPNLRFSDKTNQTAAVSQEPCQGCHHRLPCLHWISGCQNDIRCMRNLRPADVLAACHRQLPSTK